MPMSMESAAATRRQYLAAIIGNLSSFCIGNMLGWTSPMQLLLESPNTPISSGPMTREQFSWIGSINFVGAIIGSLFWGKLSDSLGRKSTGLLVAVPFALGWLVMLVATNFEWLAVGRVLVGVGCCGVIINMPTYVTEISQDRVRGRLGSFLMSSLTAGMVFSYLIGSYQDFYLLTGVSLCVPIIFAFLFFFLPESPVWLYVKGRHEEAERSLTWYRAGETDIVLSEIHNLSKRPHSKTITFFQLWRRKGTFRALLIGFGFVGGQQLCGMLGILTFAVSIFEMSGSSLSPHISAVIMASLQLTACIVSTLLVDKAGRRVLLVTSFFTMGVALVLLGTYLHRGDNAFAWLPITCLSFHLVAYSLGAGPVPYIVLSEIFPPEARGSAMSVVQFLGTSFSFIGVKIFPTLMTIMGPHGCFWFFGCANFLATLFVILCVPETKGKPLNLILQKLEGESTNKVVLENHNTIEKQMAEIKMVET